MIISLVLMGKSRFHWLYLPFLKRPGSFRRCYLSKRSIIIGSICVVYLFFVVSRIGSTQQQRDRRTDKDKYRHTRGLYNLETSDAVPESVPTRSNVVYITLRTKRFKPANIRGTIRPKLRRKVRRNNTVSLAFTHNKLSTLEQDEGRIQRNFEHKTSWRKPGNVDNVSLDLIPKSQRDKQADYHVSSIRIYSQRAPPWLSTQDVIAMRFLADAKVLRVKEVSRGDSPELLIFEGSFSVPEERHAETSSECAGQCGVIFSPVDNTEVLAFHLDRVLGLNKTLPAVSRKFSFLHDGQPCPVVSWDASLYPGGLAAGPSTVSLTWGKYQSSLKKKCWHKNIPPKLDSGCSTVHHFEWSKLALFDFLLQIHSRLDPSCCGFRPRLGDFCMELGHHVECADWDQVQLGNIVHRSHDPRHLVFTNNKGFFDRNEDNLDFRLLEGIKELPEPAVSVLRSKKLREKLLQSLFLDQTYWESQGGRLGIDKLIDVLESRVKVLLTYINAHGIKVIPMNA